MARAVCGAEMLHPAGHQPVRSVEHDRIDVGETLFALARQPPQHGVDQAGITSGAPVRLHQTHAEIDGRVVRHVQPQQLRCAEQQGGLRPRGVVGKSALEQMFDQIAKRAEPAQHGRHQAAHQRAIAVCEPGELELRGLVLDLLVERPPPAQDAIEDVSGDAARRQPRGFGPGDYRPQGPRREAWPHGPAGAGAAELRLKPPAPISAASC